MRELNKKLSSFDEVELSAAYKTVFSTVEGQLVLQDLRNRCFFDTMTFSDNPYVTCFNEGKRTVILNIETRINFEPIVEEEEDGPDN